MYSFFVVLRQSVVDLHRRTLQPGEAITQRMSTRDDEEIMPAQERGVGKNEQLKTQRRIILEVVDRLVKEQNGNEMNQGLNGKKRVLEGDGNRTLRVLTSPRGRTQ